MIVRIRQTPLRTIRLVAPLAVAALPDQDGMHHWRLTARDGTATLDVYSACAAPVSAAELRHLGIRHFAGVFAYEAKLAASLERRRTRA